jgi:LysM repeat protein
MFPGAVAPPPPGGVLGGGNVTSSANKPRTGNEQDSFDLNASSASASSVRGSGDGPVFTDGPASGMVRTGPIPSIHVVKKGDTLWTICQTYLQSPYEWPRIWSLNPHIHNPHYIEVGEKVRLRSGDDDGALAQRPSATSLGRFNPGAKRVPPATVFLREQGFIEDGDTDAWGEISGAPEDKTFLSNTDDVYLRIPSGREVSIGQELTVFRPMRSVGKGKVIAILGTVRVSQFNARDRVARATVVETIDVIERGARVGNIPRKFEVVPPKRNDKEVEAHIIASVYRHNFYGQNQIVYIDAGSEAGLQPGNRLLVERKGDGWRQSLAHGSAARRIDSESEEAARIESVPPSRDEEFYPQETVGELRVLSTRKQTSMCLVIESSREIELSEVARAKKGF